MTSAQIASDLYISENTVKTHVRHILEKLEASNRAEAVSRAIQLGIIRQ
jgi:DNA-binding NarL/FixJ family response regulator